MAFGIILLALLWHFPPKTEIRAEFLNPDYIYLSHHHFDHFHYSSLRRISGRRASSYPDSAWTSCASGFNAGATRTLPKWRTGK